jgi:sugar O-acyltransferase (sialic acid O-acetyltransferase NeuD family)
VTLIVFGAGGHGKVIAEILAAQGRVVDGFVDDGAERRGTTILGKPVLGDSAWLAEAAKAGGVMVALAIGGNAARAAIAARLHARGLELVTAVHPSAVVSPSATLGAGTVVMAHASINAEARIGVGAIVNTGAVIEHDVVLGDWSHVSPLGALAGGARLGHLSHLGTGAVVLPGVCVGDRTVVGAGAVVVRDIPSDVVVRGVPARVTRSVIA